MPITVIGGIKGGSGKTTLATNLTVISSKYDKKVLLVDADDQRSTTDWAEQRHNLAHITPWSTVQLGGSSIRSELAKLDKYDDIFVDAGGRDTTSQRAALTIANIFIVPFQPRSLDIWTIGKLITMIHEIKCINPNLMVYAVLNRGDIYGNDNQDAIDILKGYEIIKVIQQPIMQRKSISNASANGQSVIEYHPIDKKAINEFMNVYEKIYQNDIKHITNIHPNDQRSNKKTGRKKGSGNNQ